MIMQAQGLYTPKDEHDACGVGFVASIDGEARRDVVWAALNALENIWHRGAVDADGKTGDGAGIMLEIAPEFFYEHASAGGHRISRRRIGVGQIFLPRTDPDLQEKCRTLVERALHREGLVIYGWRQVPVNIEVIGEKARRSLPEIAQILIGHDGEDEAEFERILYVIRRRIEKAARQKGVQDFAICSLSCRSIVYKGLFLAEQITAFYPDLLDRRFYSRFAIFHQRYSTNTFPSWKLAQPFHTLAHNGEINTLKGNCAWMRLHERGMAHPCFGSAINDLRPVIDEGVSDSAALDSVFEILCRAGRPAPLVKNLLVPGCHDPSLQNNAYNDFLLYCHAFLEPWDGPAALAFYNGEWVCGGMDRNGLRPFRYCITEDNMIVAGSEAGMVALDESRIVEKGRISAGGTVGVNLKEGRFYREDDMRDYLSAIKDWHAETSMWRRQTIKSAETQKSSVKVPVDTKDLVTLQNVFAMTREDIELILRPMVEHGKEALGSMGDDTPLALLSERYRPLHHFFRQMFAQVTNPPIDPLRERAVMVLDTWIGTPANILDEDADLNDFEMVCGPVLSHAEHLDLQEKNKRNLAIIDTVFKAEHGSSALEKRVIAIQEEACRAVESGKSFLVLTDNTMDETHIPVPAILAASAVHTALCEAGLRGKCSLHVSSAECLDSHYVAVLIGVGSTTVNPWLSERAILHGLESGKFESTNTGQAVPSYKKALEDGLLKIMSKMGISVLSSYRGAYLFEAVGMSRTLVDTYFPHLTSRISGIGLDALEDRIVRQHGIAYTENVTTLPEGGFYRYRAGGGLHAWEGQVVSILQNAVRNNDYSEFKKYSETLRNAPLIQIRDLLELDPYASPVALDEVEPMESIRKRFVTPGMSLGALGPEAHGTLNLAMNRIGAKSDSGEGGEDPDRYTPDENGEDWNSAIKQVASGRFGVTAEYLNKCREIEIKIAQGAKPGEGGQLPGFKVTEMIARYRHATPGTTLISPPPHHDIYSIEDLAQLIYDLKQINPYARVCVKLVARSGIGTIAAGIAKAGADTILIAGHVGGTGASPQTSIKFAGIPWEMGLSEVHQVLTMNGLRNRVRLRTDGGLKTGRDIVIAAILGAEEFGIGTASLIAMGCLMVRQCHSNTCPVGICTQDDALRKYFKGTADHVVAMMTFLAQDTREYLAKTGFKSLNDIVGHTELLRQVNRGGGEALDDLDLSSLLVRPERSPSRVISLNETPNPVPDTLDAGIVDEIIMDLKKGKKFKQTYTIKNTQRTIGARISSAIVRNFDARTLCDNLAEDQVILELQGSAGQSLGAFVTRGVQIRVEGEANDFVGKGLSGGIIIVKPPQVSKLQTWKNTIIGNTVLYGATSGKLFAAGIAGERFAVRNSGAIAVVEGCGANGCEYMTGGVTVILGVVGTNFAAGMTGGEAFVYDPEKIFEQMVNPADVAWFSLPIQKESMLRSLIEKHVRNTGSDYADALLNNWKQTKQNFIYVCPKESKALRTQTYEKG